VDCRSEITKALGGLFRLYYSLFLKGNTTLYCELDFIGSKTYWTSFLNFSLFFTEANKIFPDTLHGDVMLICMGFFGDKG
jgi:hypothetical protein